PRVVPFQSRSQGRHRKLAPALQQVAPAFEPRLSDTGGVLGEARRASLSVQAGNGPGRCGTWGLRAPARCITVPQGAIDAASEGSRLKLTVVRKNRAGQVILPLQKQSDVCWTIASI